MFLSSGLSLLLSLLHFLILYPYLPVLSVFLHLLSCNPSKMKTAFIFFIVVLVAIAHSASVSPVQEPAVLPVTMRQDGDAVPTSIEDCTAQGKKYFCTRCVNPYIAFPLCYTYCGLQNPPCPKYGYNECTNERYCYVKIGPVSVIDPRCTCFSA